MVCAEKSSALTGCKLGARVPCLELQYAKGAVMTEKSASRGTQLVASQYRPDREAVLDALAARYRSANGVGMQVLALVGGQAEGILKRLPKSVTDQMDGLTRAALETSFDVAARSRVALPDQRDWLNAVVAMGTGAAGGMGGLPSAVAELPVTTTVILRAVQGIAAEHGYDPRDEATRLDCLQVFAAAGPLADDDGVDTSFLSMRLGLTGATLQGVLVRVAPRLAAVLGQKLAAQTVPILGAVAGAAINYAFTSYYQDMARVNFGLRLLADGLGEDRADLIEDFRKRVEQPRIRRAG